MADHITDFSGTVVKLGNNLAKKWNVGDRVAGVVHGGKQGTSQMGAFAEYTLMRSHNGLKIPDSMSDAQAATLGVGTITLACGPYQQLNLPWPDQASRVKTSTILVYGGSTATGLFAIQMFKLSGLHVLVTCSPHNFEKVKALGADEAFDYHDADACASAIRQATKDQLYLAFDTFAEGDSIKICAGALSSVPGTARYLANLGYEPVRDPQDLWGSWVYAYTSFGEEFEDLGTRWEVKPEDVHFAARFWLEVQQQCEAGKIKTFPIIRDGGIEAIPDGLNKLRKGEVSGGKLVYKISG